MAYYVRIEKPRQFRRDILEASKVVITNLQSYKSVQAIREKKLSYLVSLQKEVKEIRLLYSKLNKILPEKQLREEALKEKVLSPKAAVEKIEKQSARKKKNGAKKAASKKKVKVVKEEEKKPKVSEVDKLADTLSDIERRLSNLQ